jgi:nicotinamidase-related amidase
MSKVLLALAASVVLGYAKTALLVVDVQDCFLEAACTGNGTDGSLSVPACEIIPKINQLLDTLVFVQDYHPPKPERLCSFDEVIFTQDYHPTNHISYGSSHGLAAFAHLGGLGGLPLMCIDPASGLTSDGACCPKFYLQPSMNCTAELCPPPGWDYAVNNSGIITNNSACTVCAATPAECFEMSQSMWPDHCLQSGDSGFPPTLYKDPTDTVIQKGTNQFVDAYSAFMDNTQTLKTSLDSMLMGKGINRLYIVGIATDVCVQWTVTDALGNSTANYEVIVVSDATAPVLGNMAKFNASIATMIGAGATVMSTADVLAAECSLSDMATISSRPTTVLIGVVLYLMVKLRFF